MAEGRAGDPSSLGVSDAADPRYRFLFENNLAGVYRTTPDGEILVCNDAFADIYGYASASEVLSDRALEQYADPGDREAFLEELRREGHVYNFEQKRKRRDGSPVWVLESAALTADPETGDEVIVGTVIDITDRKEAEQARRVSEHRYRLLFEHNVAGVYRSTPEGEVLEVNEAWLEMMGYESEEELTDAESLYRDPAAREAWIQALREEGQLTNYEAILEGADGRPVWVLENSLLVEDPEAGEMILGIAVDITEERLLERRYRQILEENVAGVYRSRPDGRMLECNQALADMFGYGSVEATLDDQAWSHYPDQAMREAFLETLREEGRVRNYEQRYRRRDGSEFWALENASLTADPEGDGEIIIGTVLDITQQKRAEEARRATQQRYRLLFEHNVAGVYRSTPEGEVLEVNDAFLDMLGYGSLETFEEDVESGAHEVYVDPEHRERWLEALRGSDEVTNWEVQFQRKDGSTLWVLENATLAEDPETGREIIIGTVTDITDQKHLEEELERLAFRDPLTGLANRRMLREQVERALAEADRRGDRVGLMYIDLTRFKRVNDTLGHEAGDRVLVEVARRIRAHLRASDLAARMGGDEFAVLLTELGEVRSAVVAAERVVEELEAPVRVGDRDVSVDADIGVAVYPDHGSNFEELVRNADRSMYRAKSETAVQVEIHGSADGLPRHDDSAVENALRAALEEEQLTVFYQPVERLRQYRTAGVEALVRWEHPDRGLLRAAEFVPLAEKLGVVAELDRWVLGEAVRQAGAWGEGTGPGWVAVNLSGQSLHDRELPGRVEELLASASVDPERLVVEITERSALRDMDRAVRVLRELSDRGVRIAIDDFGRGPSVLTHLKHFPTDVLKVDTVFVEGVDETDRNRQLMKAVVDLARRMGIEVVAKGVERQHQYEWIQRSGCDCAQGYFVGRPAPPGDLAFDEETDG